MFRNTILGDACDSVAELCGRARRKFSTKVEYTPAAAAVTPVARKPVGLPGIIRAVMVAVWTVALMFPGAVMAEDVLTVTPATPALVNPINVIAFGSAILAAVALVMVAAFGVTGSVKLGKKAYSWMLGRI